MSNLRRRRPQDGPLHDDREQSPIAAQTTPTRHDIDDGVSNLRIVLNIIVRRAITHRLSAAPSPLHKPLIILQSRRFFTRQRYSFDKNDQQPPLVRTVPPAWSFFLARVAWIIFESGTVDCNHLVIHQFVKGVATVPTFGTVDEILPSSFEDEILLLPLRLPRNVLTIFVHGELGEIPFVLLCWLS